VVWPTRNRPIKIFSLWFAIPASIAGGLLVALLVALFWPSTYSATSSFFVSGQAEILANLQRQGATTDTADLQSLKPTQERLAAILGSRLLRSRLVKAHQLAEKLRIDPSEAEEDLTRMVKVEAIGKEGFTITVTCRGFSRLRVALGHSFGRAEARQLCAGLANSYLTELQDYVTNTSVGEAQRKRQFLEASLRQIRSQLQVTETRLQELQRQFELLDPSAKALLLTDRIKTLEQARAEDLARLKETAGSLKAAEGQLCGTDVMTIATIVEARNPVITQLEQKLAQLKLDLAAERATGKTDQNRDVQQIISAIDSTEKQLRTVHQQVQTEVSKHTNPAYDKLASQVVDLRVTLAGAQARSGQSALLLRGVKTQLNQLPAVAREYAAIRQDQDVQTQTLAQLKQSLAVASLQEQQSKLAGQFLVLDQASPPPDLYGPPIWLSALLTFAVILCTLGLMSLNRMIFGA
jgi:uncharacterized protein involved in exopolysaccharide biosynthesis